MKIAATISINLSKIDKSRIKEVTLKDGTVAKFVNLYTTLDSDNPGQYGDHGFISHSVSKEERDAGEKGTIIGNAKIVFISNEDISSSPKKISEKPQDAFFDDDLPF